MSQMSEQEVQAYLDQHKIQTTVEDAINACVKANAADPCLFMSQHLASKAGPETITTVKARQIFDSRGNPTVEVDVVTTKSKYSAMVPSGASTGIYEALEMRDGDKANYMGKGVSKAVENVNSIIGPALAGMNPADQKAIDDKMVMELDGSKNEWGWSKSKLGANAILGVSMAVCKAGAAAKGLPLYKHIAELAGNPTDKMYMPVPSFNIINGGSHAGNKLAMQEFMILPVGATNFTEVHLRAHAHPPACPRASAPSVAASRACPPPVHPAHARHTLPPPLLIGVDRAAAAAAAALGRR